LATTIEPLRASSRLGVTTKLTDPFPLPAAEDVTLIHVTSGDAVQAQSVGVAMLNVPEPPLAWRALRHACLLAIHDNHAVAR
jgi:hypothetical protein